MTMTDGRHERHMMRQRGAGARSIPTNFGFIFQAGPVQLSANAPTESPATTNEPLPVASYPEHPRALEPPHAGEIAVPKRKRVIREDDEEDQVWFSKRSKKTTTVQQDESTIVSTVSGEAALDKPQTQTPAETKPTKPTKRKVVRKRILVPKSRQKAPIGSGPQPRLEQPLVSANPAIEDNSKPQRKTRTKTVAVRKQKSEDLVTPAVPVQGDEQDNDLINHPNIKPAPLEKAREEETKITKPSAPSEKEETEGKPKAKVTRKRKVVKRHVDESVQQDVTSDNRANLADHTEEQPLMLEKVEKPTDEPTQAEKKRKVVKRVRVPRTTKTKVVPEKDDQKADEATQDVLKPHRAKRSSPLEEGTTNPYPKRPETSLAEESLPDKKNSTRERKPRQLIAKNPDRIEDTVSEDVSSLAARNKSLHHSEPVAAGAENADFALFEAEAPILATKRATKAPRRVFRDDSEIDLDQMLSGIAAMTGTEATKPSVTKSTRVAKRKAAVS